MISTFLKTHERLILILAGLLLVFYLGQKWVSHIAEVDTVKAVQAQQVLAAQTATNTQQAEVVKQMEAVTAQLVSQLTQQNQQLISSINARSQVTVVQQAKDKTLPLPELTTRWQGLAGLAPSDLTAENGGIGVTDAGARLTVQKLEMVPELLGTIEDGKQILANKDQEIASDERLVGGLKDQVSGLNLQIAAGDKACKAEITAVKAVARKGKWKAFGYGVGIGIAAVVTIASRVL